MMHTDMKSVLTNLRSHDTTQQVGHRLKKKRATIKKKGSGDAGVMRPLSKELKNGPILTFTNNLRCTECRKQQTSTFLP